MIKSWDTWVYNLCEALDDLEYEALIKKHSLWHHSQNKLTLEQTAKKLLNS